jgi:hypothetical protein
MTVEMEEKKGDAKNKVRKAVWAQEARISRRGSYRRTELGNSNCHYSVGKRIEVRAPKRAVS